MITTLSGILSEFLNKQAEILDAETVRHAPTIGAMYEGLTREMLDRGIPKELDLQVVEGFIEGADGSLSPQMDVMLVTGQGRNIPYTSSRIWPIRDVLAVIEVKKNLFGADLAESYLKLRTVSEMARVHLGSGELDGLNVRSSFQAFALTTGRYPRGWQAANSQSDDLSAIFHTLVGEQVAPVRVVIGYHGYSTESGLRSGLVRFLEQNMASAGFGVSSLPNLIVCAKSSILKLNGQPYTSFLSQDRWPVLASNGENPIRILLEMVWSKIVNRFDLDIELDDSLQQERCTRYIDAKFVQRELVQGWEYMFTEASKDNLADKKDSLWEPLQTDRFEWVLLYQFMCRQEVNVFEKDFRDYAAKEGFDADALVSDLVNRRILAWVDDKHIRMISEDSFAMTFMPDGRSVVSNRLALLGLWLEKEL